MGCAPLDADAARGAAAAGEDGDARRELRGGELADLFEWLEGSDEK